MLVVLDDSAVGHHLVHSKMHAHSKSEDHALFSQVLENLGWLWSSLEPNLDANLMILGSKIKIGKFRIVDEMFQFLRTKF